MSIVCRPPRGGRGLKYYIDYPTYQHGSRPPRGGRGLKYFLGEVIKELAQRRPPRGGRGLK